LRPSSTGAFLIVYDGELFGGGEIAITALLTRGGTMRQQSLALRP